MLFWIQIRSLLWLKKPKKDSEKQHLAIFCVPRTPEIANKKDS